jgi:NAD(P)-dependent dehydrogenase (short-subunit alcohol dehydrogenase family)
MPMSVVLITGSGSGFGEAIAVAFAQQGHQVVATMRRPDSAPVSLKSLVAERPSAVIITTLDVSDPEARRRAVNLTLNTFGRLDILVNCAGVGATGSLEDMPESGLHKVFDTNFFGPLELMRLALPVMRKQRAGRIINITSVASLFSTPFMSAYTASKQALDAASVAADIESRSFGVRVAAIVAGPFKTGLPAKSLDIAPSAAYSTTHGNYKSFFSKLEDHAAVDLSPVVKTVMAAATDADPPLRYLVGAEGITFLPNLLQALAPEQFFALLATGQQK